MMQTMQAPPAPLFADPPPPPPPPPLPLSLPLTASALRQTPQHVIPCPTSPCKLPWGSTGTWDYDYGELWKAWAASGRGGLGRVSCSSIESGSSFEDYLTNEVDYNNNESDRYNNNNIKGSRDDTTSTTTTTLIGREDRNNNSVLIVPSNNNPEVEKQEELEDVANNNKINNNISGEENAEKTKEATQSKNSCAGRTRLLDEDGFILRAASVCVDETETKVLLVSGKKDPCSWMVPGGGVEEGEEMPLAAIREAWEEAGVQGHIKRYLGVFETHQQGGHKRHRTAVFVVSVKQVLAEYPEAHLGRRREWFTLKDALAHLHTHRPKQSAYLERLLLSLSLKSNTT